MSKPDEKAIERDFCAGVLSLQAVADKYGITIKALRYMAGKYGWVRAKGTRAKEVQKVGAKKVSAPKKIAPKFTQDSDVRVSKGEQNLSEDNAPDEDTELGFDPDEFGLSDQQALFVYWYVKTKNRVEAYKKAGYKCEGNSAYAAASRMYRNVKVSRVIRYFRDKYQQRYAAEIDEVIHQLVSITRANPNDLSQYRRVNCRYCWGEHHLYQWRDIVEFDKASAAAAKDGKKEPEYGGLGFVDTADPNPDCPKCFGEGLGQVFITDTRDLDGDARWLYAGVKETKFGIEMQSSSQEAARRELVKLLASHNTGSRKNELAEQLIELEIRKRTAEAERLEQENAEKRAPSKGGEAPTIVINLVNSPDAE